MQTTLRHVNLTRYCPNRREMDRSEHKNKVDNVTALVSVNCVVNVLIEHNLVNSNVLKYRKSDRSIDIQRAFCKKKI